MSRADAEQEAWKRLREEGLLPEDAAERDACIAKLADEIYLNQQRIERDHHKKHELAAPNAPSECVAERLAIDNENRWIIGQAVMLLSG